MKRYLILLILYMAALPALVPTQAHAQKAGLRQAAKALTGYNAAAATKLPALLPRIETAAAVAARQAAVQAAARKAAVKDIRLSVAKLQSALLKDMPEAKQPTATAFIFKTTYNGKEEVWGATAGHIAKGMGNNLLLIFYEGDQKFVVPAQVVQYGPNMISDIALLKLPDNLPAQINPLPLAEPPFALGESFISAGYCAHDLVYTGKQALQKDNQRFLRTDYTVPLSKRAGLCGAPLINSQGAVTGIHCGSVWNNTTGYASNVKVLSYLLKAQHEGTAEIPLVAGKVVFGNIKTTEHIHSIEALDAEFRDLARYDTANRLTQSTMLSLLQEPGTRYLRFMLEDRKANPVDFNMRNDFRYLIYDKETQTSRFEPIHW